MELVWRSYSRATNFDRSSKTALSAPAESPRDTSLCRHMEKFGEWKSLLLVMAETLVARIDFFERF